MVHDVVAIRDIYDIKGWIKEKKELIAAIKKMNIEIYFRPITSPFIVKKEGTEFEFHQKGSMFVVIDNEHEYLFVRELLMENGIYFTVYDKIKCLLLAVRILVYYCPKLSANV